MKPAASKSALAVLSSLFQTLSGEPRLAILLAIGEGEACVCHLEAVLGYRQAYISQHLMALREAGLLTARRVGKYMFYRLAKPGLLDLLRMAQTVVGLRDMPRPAGPAMRCACPTCSRPA